MKAFGLFVFALLACFDVHAQGMARLIDAEEASTCRELTEATCSTSRGIERCTPWHQRNAVNSGADSVVIGAKDPNPHLLFIGKKSEVKAKYYVCVEPEPVIAKPYVKEPDPEFPMGAQWDLFSADYTTYSGSGVTAISGQAFLRQRNGGVVTCAGSDVFAIPVGTFFDFIEHPWRALRAKDEDFDPRAKLLIRHTVCDAQGNFKFSKLPKANWRIVTDVQWDVPDRFANRQGGYLSKRTESSLAPEPVYMTDSDRVY